MVQLKAQLKYQSSYIKVKFKRMWRKMSHFPYPFDCTWFLVMDLGSTGYDLFASQGQGQFTVKFMLLPANEVARG